MDVRIAEDGEILVRGINVLRGYWNNEAATKEALEDGWFHTGDLGSLDEDGFLRITGRKKEILVTAGGKNVAPAPLEDRLRAHPLISQCLVVGDGRKFISALITLDEEALGPWKERHGKPASMTVDELRGDPDVLAEIEAAVAEANKSVSQAEAIKKSRHPRRRLHRGGRPPDAEPEGQAQRRDEGLRRRDRGALQQLISTAPITAAARPDGRAAVLSGPPFFPGRCSSRGAARSGRPVSGRPRAGRRRRPPRGCRR